MTTETMTPAKSKITSKARTAEDVMTRELLFVDENLTLSELGRGLLQPFTNGSSLSRTHP
ncbi:MAG TPA: hypothetical protein VMT85_14700 [Thermoanaerobaculia bacterium]|nr:hypothetical protein [Thermoanaerobaculia bacterium]